MKLEEDPTRREVKLSEDFRVYLDRTASSFTDIF